jgi:AcrR family transcriptional regulator
MPRTKLKSDDEVLDAVGRVVSQHGPQGLTLANVGAEIGLSAATLVQRFGTRRGLLVAFAKRASERGSEPFSVAARSSRSPLATLRRGLADMALEAVKNGFEQNLAFLLEDVRDDELRALAAAHAERVEASLFELLTLAKQRGEIAGDVRASARAVHAVYNGALIQWALRRQGTVDAWVLQVVDTVLHPQAVSARTRRKRA